MPHERLAKLTGATDLGGAATHRLAREAIVGIPRTLARDGWPDYVFAFHDSEEIGPKMLARISKRTGLTPEEL